jgi:hypothetical protein
VALFKRLEADPEKTYPLTDQQGPWMIMAATFSGDEAELQARELIYELRSRYKLAAYTHEVDFDYTAGTQGRGLDQYGGPARLKYARGNHLREIGVLVGDYPSVDSPEAQRVLERLKYAQPDCLNLEKRAKAGKRENRSLAALRLAQQVVQEYAGSKNKLKGPMGHAFITTNPLLPEEYFSRRGLDKLVLEMNEQVQYSLLDCPGPYTCRVATFTGNAVIDPKLVEAVERGKQMPSRLEQAALKAHQLTVALRSKGYEAYEFHDRYASIVTVGSFASLGTPLGNGTIKTDPRLQAVIGTFAADVRAVPGEAAPRVENIKDLAHIPFDIQPMPIEVPRRPIGADYDVPIFSMR